MRSFVISAVFFNCSPSMSRRINLHPFLANSKACARPRAPPAPVSRTVLPARELRKGFVCLLLYALYFVYNQNSNAGKSNFEKTLPRKILRISAPRSVDVLALTSDVCSVITMLGDATGIIVVVLRAVIFQIGFVSLHGFEAHLFTRPYRVRFRNTQRALSEVNVCFHTRVHSVSTGRFWNSSRGVIAEL
jgi:hypothetical protein